MSKAEHSVLALASNATATRWLVRAVATGALACLALQAHGEEFRAVDVLASDFPTGRALDHMSQQLREHTEGRHGLRIWYGPEQGSERLLIEKVRSGAFDLARVEVASLHSLVPTTALLSMRLLYPSEDAYRRAFGGPIAETVAGDLEQAGFIVLAYYRTGVRSFYSSLRPVRTIEDLRGLRLRVLQKDAWAAALEGFGARAVPVPIDRVRASFGAGMIDAAEGSWSLYAASRHHEVARHFSLTEHGASLSMVLFSRQRWDRLTPEDRTALRHAAEASVGFFDPLWQESEVTSRRTVEQAGAQVTVDGDRAALRLALRAAWLAQVRDRRLLELVPAADAAEK